MKFIGIIKWTPLGVTLVGNGNSEHRMGLSRWKEPNGGMASLFMVPENTYALVMKKTQKNGSSKQAVWGYPYTSRVQIGGTCPPGWLQMSERPPSPHYICSPNIDNTGDWILPDPMPFWKRTMMWIRLNFSYHWDRLKYNIYLSHSFFYLFVIPDSKRKLFTYVAFFLSIFLAYVFKNNPLSFSIFTSCTAAAIFDYFINILNLIYKRRDLAYYIVQNFSPVLWRKNYLISLIKNSSSNNNHDFLNTEYTVDTIEDDIKEFIKNKKFKKDIYPIKHYTEKKYSRPIQCIDYIEESIMLFNLSLNRILEKNISEFNIFYDSVTHIVSSYNSIENGDYISKATKRMSYFHNFLIDPIIQYITFVEMLEYLFYTEVLPYAKSPQFQRRKSILINEASFKKYICGEVPRHLLLR